MQFTDIDTFLAYYKRIQARTDLAISHIPLDKMEWTYQQGKFTFGDLIRHIATIERFMYAENAQFRPSLYPGHEIGLAADHGGTRAYYKAMRKESWDIFAQLTPDDLQRKTMTPGGFPITLWKWMRAMVEHEIHHRGQIFIYLGLVGAAAPPLYGLTSEEVIKRSKW